MSDSYSKATPPRSQALNSVICKNRFIAVQDAIFDRWGGDSWFTTYAIHAKYDRANLILFLSAEEQLLLRFIARCTLGQGVESGPIPRDDFLLGVYAKLGPVTGGFNHDPDYPPPVFEGFTEETELVITGLPFGEKTIIDVHESLLDKQFIFIWQDKDPKDPRFICDWYQVNYEKIVAGPPLCREARIGCPIISTWEDPEEREKGRRIELRVERKLACEAARAAGLPPPPRRKPIKRK